MTIKLSSKGGGGVLTTSFASNVIEVNFGATGTFVILTPPTGERVFLTSLSSSGVTQTNLTTVTIGGSDVIIDAKLDASGTSFPDVGEAKIGVNSGNQPYIIGGIDEVLEIKTSTSTSTGTFYSYQFGS